MTSREIINIIIVVFVLVIAFILIRWMLAETNDPAAYLSNIVNAAVTPMDVRGPTK